MEIIDLNGRSVGFCSCFEIVVVCVDLRVVIVSNAASVKSVYEVVEAGFSTESLIDIGWSSFSSSTRVITVDDVTSVDDIASNSIFFVVVVDVDILGDVILSISCKDSVGASVFVRNMSPMYI